MAELSRSWTDGQQQDRLAEDNPGGDGGNAEEGLDPGGRAVTHYLATAARQHTTVPPQHSFSALSLSVCRFFQLTTCSSFSILPIGRVYDDNAYTHTHIHTRRRGARGTLMNFLETIND